MPTPTQEIVESPQTIAEFGPVESPQTIAEFGLWLNEWGNLNAYPYSGKEVRAYEQAMRDAYEHFDRLYPNWSKET